MKIKIKLHPNSSQEKIEKLDNESYEVWIKEKPLDGKANQNLMKFLKKTLFGDKKTIKIVSGLRSRYKTIEVN